MYCEPQFSLNHFYIKINNWHTLYWLPGSFHNNNPSHISEAINNWYTSYNKMERTFVRYLPWSPLPLSWVFHHRLLDYLWLSAYPHPALLDFLIWLLPLYLIVYLSLLCITVDSAAYKKISRKMKNQSEWNIRIAMLLNGNFCVSNSSFIMLSMLE